MGVFHIADFFLEESGSRIKNRRLQVFLDVLGYARWRQSSVLADGYRSCVDLGPVTLSLKRRGTPFPLDPPVLAPDKSRGDS